MARAPVGGKAKPRPVAKAKPKAKPKAVQKPYNGGLSPSQAYGGINPGLKQPAPTKQGSGTSTDSTGPDPFAGTPYAGMSPYEIAQKIVNDEIGQQASQISAARDRQAQINQNQLSILAALGTQLQKGMGQFANNYANDVGGLMNSYQGFTKGYQDTMNGFQQQAVQSGAGGYQPGQNFVAQPQQDGANILQTALNTNPFTVLPAAYGRMAQMDANLLAANQASDMNQTYGVPLEQLYQGADSAIMQEFMQIQGMFNDAAASAQAQQQATLDAQAKAAADKQKLYQWQYGQAENNAKLLTQQTGTLYQVDPNTLQVYQVKDKSGRPVITLPGQQAGLRQQTVASENQNRLSEIQSRRAAIIQRQQGLELRAQSLQETIRNHNVSAQQRAQAQRELQQNRAQQNALARQRLALEKQRLALQKQRDAVLNKKDQAGGSRSSTSAQNSVQNRQASHYKQATAYAQGQATKTNKLTGLGSQYNKDQVRTQVWNRYEKTFLADATQMKKLGLIKVKPRAMAEYWINEIIASIYRS